MNALHAYQLTSVRTASPLALVVMLYDTAIRSLNDAVRAVEANDIEKRTAALNHVIAVIGELQAALDFGRGGDVALYLSKFYGQARGKIIEASIKGSKEMLRQLGEQFFMLRDAWEQVSGKAVETANPIAPSRPFVRGEPCRWSA